MTIEKNRLATGSWWSIAMTIECVNFKSHQQGTLLGFADLFVPKMGIYINGCTLHQKNGFRFFYLPSRDYKNEEGETKYAPVVKFHNKDHYKLFCQEAIKAIELYCSSKGVS